MAGRWASQGNARDLHAYACRIYVVALRASIGLYRYAPAHPATPPLSASCSSDQHFACDFLQIPPHDGHPCRSANTSPCRVCRGLSPPSHLSRHHNESDSASHGATRHAWRTQKKRGSLSRAKSTPKEEGGGDKSEPNLVRTLRIMPERQPLSKHFCASHNINNKSIYK